MTADDEQGLGWEDAYRSPAGREPAAPPPARPARAGGASSEPAEPPASPAWGTPESAPAKQGPVPVVPPRRATAPTGPPPAVTGLFRLLVEQTGGSGDTMRWKLEPEPSHAFPDRDTARLAAVDLCRHFAPQHPFSEQRRRIYRITPDEYLVTVQGLTSMFHFRVSVAEEIG
jgi:hypothetical protein